MAAFEELTFSVEEFSGVVRLFPLPNLALFPHVMQPLHIFEPRYRAMLEDALAGDRLIAMALLTPGWEADYEGRPPVYPVACLGRITSACRLADGTYNLLLLGLKRVKLLDELASLREFREAPVTILEDAYPPQKISRSGALQRRLRAALLRLVPCRPEVREQLDQLLEGDVSLGLLTDVLGFLADIGVEQKLALLAEADVFRRAEMLLEYFTPTVDGEIGSLLGDRFPPLFSTN
jgi:uncharacterized protein